MRRALFPVLLLVTACATPVEPGLAPPAVGDSAPALDLPATGNETFSLADATGNGAVVVVFYRGLF